MKTILLVFLTTTLFSASTYADAPTFVKVGSTYSLTANSGAAIPHLVTITAVGGGGWFRVSTPNDSGPNAHPVAGLGDRWINFSQIVEVRETAVKNPPE
jgi:hypothetical protein